MNKKSFKRKSTEEKQEFDRNILDLARVTRVTKGGKQLSFRACVVLGNRNGRVGMGLAKGKDVQIAVDKAVNQAKKKMIDVPIINNTIAHPVEVKFKAAKVLLHPAPAGSGIIAGGALRVILELAGISDVSAKILSKTKNKVSVANAAIEALRSFKNYEKLVANNKPTKPVTDEKVKMIKKPFNKKSVAKKEVKK